MTAEEAEIRAMAEIANRLAKRMGKSFVLDERKLRAYLDHNMKNQING